MEGVVTHQIRRTPRRHADSILGAVRSFYLDIAAWAHRGSSCVGALGRLMSRQHS